MSKNKVGRPRHSKEVKVKKSVSVDPWKLEKILKDFPNFSIAVDILMASYISKEKK